MDPFKLTVKQVNFEAEDLPFIDNLDSFGWTISSLEDFRLQLQVDEQKSPYISFCTEVDKTRRARRNCRLARPFPLGRKRTASDSDLHRVIRELEYIPDDCREAAPSRDPFQEVGVHQAAPWRLAAGDVFPSLRVASVATDSLRTASTDTSGSCATVCSQSYGGTAVSTGATRGQQQWLQVNGRVSPEARQAVRDSKSVAELSQTFRGLGISSHEPVKEPTAVPVSSLLSVYRYKDLELTRQACKTGFICRRPTVDYSPVKLSLEPPVLSTVCDTPVLVNNSPSSSYSPVKVTAVSVTTVTGKTCRIHTKTIISETEAKQGTPQWLQAYTITRMSSNIESDVHVTPIVSRQSGVQDSLTALTETTEALALQESVIGGATVKPAPPDVVAAVIAESQRKYRLKMASDQGHGSRTFEGGDDASLPVGTELFELMESAEGGSPSGESKKRKAKKGNKKDQKRKWLERAKELDKEIDNTSTVSVSSQAMDTSGDASMSTSLLVSQVKHASDACDNDDDATLEGALTEEELSSLQDLTADIPHGGYVPPTERPTRSGSPPTERPTRSGSPPTRDDSSSCAAPFHFATSTPARDCDTTTSSVYFTPASAGAATSGGGSDYYELLREKSHLEGRLEAVMADGRASLREKSELKAELARSRSRLRSQADASHVAAGERDASVADLASLRGHREQLERSLVALQGALEEKAAEMGLAQVALSGMRETNEGLQARIDELKTELQAKEGVVKDLKDKIVELHVELQTTVQEKMQADNSSRSLKNEMAATLSAKDWYQEQLKFAQEVRSKIQKELAQLQTSAVVQGSLVEKLRSENAQVRQQLLESQQRAMQDKESLARNLETIQADIMEREAAFEQVEREKNMTQESIRTKLHATEEERSKMFTLTIKSTELEHQLELATNELKVREAALATFEDQQKELLSRLALSQEAIATKDLEHDEVTQQYMKLQSKLAALQKDMDARDADIHRLKESKAAVEVQLSSAQDEKKVFDLALQKLKGDMNRVEHSYRLMRQELNVKSTRLEEVQRDKDRLEMELAAAQEQVQTRMDVTAHQVAASAMDDLRTQRLGYEEELMKLRQAKQSMMSTCQGLDKEKDGLQQALLTTHKRFSDLEMHLQDALGQRAALEQQVSEMTAVHTLGADKQQKQSHKELSKQKAKVVRLMKELEEVRDELERKQDEYNSKVNVLTQQLQTASAVRSKAEDELRHLNQAETTAVPPDSAADLTGRDAELLAVESADVDDAAADACRDVVVSEGDGVLPEADQGADDAGRRASATEQAGGASMQLMLALQQLENTREEKEDLEEQLEEVSNLFKSSVEEYQQHIAGLQVALEQARADASEHQTEELARCLQLELEKEKGRLAGVEETHQALKEHTDSLEATLAGRETTIVELDAHAQAVLLSKEQENQTCRQRMKSLQREIDEHRRSIKELRTQLLSEKGGSVRNKRNVESMTMKLDQLGQDLKNKCEEVQLLRVEFDRSRNSEMRYRERCSQLDTEVKALRTDVERLRRQLVDTEAKDPVLVEQMKTLTWHLRQKNIEIDGLREQLQLSEERQGAEIDNVKKNSLVSGKELESIRHELANTREEKFSYQAKMVELQAALKATVEHNEMLKKLQKGEVGEEESILAQPRYSMAAIEELLQQSVASAKSRPLHSLQACLKNLRNEMQQLQQQVSDHTNAIQNTAQSWRHVESQVKVIKEQCTSGLMGTTNSPTTTNSNSQTAVEIV